jgi:hypothetical protein
MKRLLLLLSLVALAWFALDRPETPADFAARCRKAGL